MPGEIDLAAPSNSEACNQSAIVIWHEENTDRPVCVTWRGRSVQLHNKYLGPGLGMAVARVYLRSLVGKLMALSSQVQRYEPPGALRAGATDGFMKERSVILATLQTYHQL